MTTTPQPSPGQVKARLLPLSSSAGAVEWLIERLPRLLIRVELKPDHDVAVVDECLGEYKATGNAPSFVMAFAPSLPPQGGWYYLEAALVRHNGSREAFIRAHIRSAERILSIPIPTNLRGTVREVLYLPPNVAALYWIPTIDQGFFSQSSFLLHKISALESLLRRMSRVLFDLWRFRNRTSANRAGLSWWSAIGNLQNAYQRTATLRIKRLVGIDYAAFIALNDSPSKSDLRALRRQLTLLPLRPVISLIMPVQVPIAEFFRAALDSVIGQLYPHWELLLAGDFSDDAQGRAIIEEYRSHNTRIKIVSAEPGVDLTTAFNVALEVAQGEFIARINQHDLIPSHALFLLAREIGQYPDADLIYTDDDNIDESNKRLEPRFKPDWNPDLLFSYNYLSNLILYRRAHALKLGGYRTGFEGAEDYDLSLRYTGDIPKANIRHIPRVLYHTRTLCQTFVSTSSPCSSENMSDGVAHQSGKRALEAYFEGSGASVENGSAPGLYHVKHPLPAQLPLVSIIIPTRDKVEILRACIESIQQKTDYANWEILVVDNQSSEPDTLTYFEQIKFDARIKIIRYEKPFNYSAMNNMAAKYANGEILALLNNDVEVIAKEWLSEMVSHALRPEIGAVGAKLLFSNGRVQHAGVITGLGGVAGHAHKYLKWDDHGYGHRAIVTQNLSAVTGACLVVKKSCYEEAGGLNEADLAVAFNDIDFCLRLLNLGYRNVYTPYALLYHHESISRGHDDTPEKHALLMRESEYMKKTWGKLLQLDPAYNPNLMLEFEGFLFSESKRFIW